MGALTIKPYAYESRSWELERMIFPNLFSIVPQFLHLSIKNDRILRIFPWDRNDFISNNIRFNFPMLQNIFNLRNSIFNETPIRKYNYYLFYEILGVLDLIKKFKFLLNLTIIHKPSVIYSFEETSLFNITPIPFILNHRSNILFLTSFLFEDTDNLISCLFDIDNFIVFDKSFKFSFSDFYFNLLKSHFHYTESEIEGCELEDLEDIFDHGLYIEEKGSRFFCDMNLFESSKFLKLFLNNFFKNIYVESSSFFVFFFCKDLFNLHYFEDCVELFFPYVFEYREYSPFFLSSETFGLLNSSAHLTACL